MRDRTFDSCTYDVEGGGGGGGGDGGGRGGGGSGVEATGFSGGGGGGGAGGGGGGNNSSSTSVELQQPSEEEEQLSVLPDSREFGCVPLCSATCARPRNCCSSLESQKRTGCLHNGFLSRGCDGEEDRGDSDEVPTLRDSDQAVQRVIKVSDGEIQLQVIGSELSCVREEKPQKRKKKFIIILKGLLNKSNKSDRKKQQSENSADNRENCSNRSAESKAEGDRKSNCLEKNKSESNLTKIKECCLSKDNANSYKSENNISLGKCKGCDSNRKCLASSNNSISSNNYYRSQINAACNRRKFTGTTVGTQERLTLLYYAALTGSAYKENGEKGPICQDLVGGVSRTEKETEEEERVPQPAESRPPRDVIPEDSLKEDGEDAAADVHSVSQEDSSSSCLSTGSSEESVGGQEEEWLEKDFVEPETALCSESLELLEDSDRSVSCLPESENQIRCDPTNSDYDSDLDPEDSCVKECDSLPDSVQERTRGSSFSAGDSGSSSNGNDICENVCVGENINANGILVCDTKDRSVSEPILNSCNETFSPSFNVTRLESKSVCLENRCSLGGREISADEIDPWAKGVSCDFSSESDESDSSSDSSVDIPPVDDYIYDLQFDPYFYQGSLSLEDVPDDQPIDYPCPYDSEGRLIRNQVPEYNTHFSYIDNHSYNPISNLGDIYRTQSQPEDISRRIYENTPLDGNAPLHVFLSQPIPNQVPYSFPARNCQLKPRKRGEFSSLCSFGGSQLYTITEEAEWDPLEEDIYSRRQYSDGEFYTRRNYSESDIYLGYDDGYCGEPYYMNPDLYYGDTDTESDSDKTIHSESSHCDSTETLDRDEYSEDLDNQTLHECIEAETHNSLNNSDDERSTKSSPIDATCVEQLSDCNSISSCQEEAIESASEADTNVIEICHEDYAISEKEEGLSYHEGDAEGACHSEYPDEFFLFCSEAEITDMEVMDTVEVLPYNGSKDFNYFKVEDKRSNNSSPIDQDFLMDNYNYSSKNSIGKNRYWDHCKDSLEKMSSTPIYQNIPINSRLSKSNPNLAALSEDSAPAKPIYQNVPVPSKRYHVPSRGQSFTTDLIGSNSDDDLDYVSHNKDRYNSSFTSNGRSRAKQVSRRSDTHEPNSKPLSKDDNDVQMTLHKWSSSNWRDGDLSTIGSTSTPSGMNQGWQDLSVAGTTPAEFNAYASNTSLDHDAFSKTSKIYKWNGSSSVSDLTSLSRELSPTSMGVAKTSASTSDLRTIGGGGGAGGGGHDSYSDDENFQELLSETSYAAWSAKVHNDLDDQDFVLPVNMKNSSNFSFASHGKSGNRAMMEFYVNNLTSDSDSDNDSAGSSTSASGGSHDLEEEVVEHQQQMLDRTYQVIGGADTVLDTIEEDVEEDSGAESSGHWMFSADNTDTDSVIHVPAILDLRPYPVEAVKESESTDSDGTIVTEEDVTESVCRPEVASNSSSRQETGVTEGNSHVEEAPASHHPHPHPHPGSSASDEEEEEENDDSDLGSRGVEPVTVGGGRVGSPTYPSSDAAAKDHSGIRSRSERDSNGGVNAGDCKGRGGGGLPAG
ncbi:uncharacterized protein LOC135216074 isoform X2 [Macrobrachium nipponense]|uniref:uncharacterized protein LOC135216074 isoform X2 n=1 Tax=Macrobrachium nipponense TaxID=159736 RepID=UPI0030C890FB